MFLSQDVPFWRIVHGSQLLKHKVLCMNRKPYPGWVPFMCVCVEGMTGVSHRFIPFHVLPSLCVYMCVCPVSAQRVCVHLDYSTGAASCIRGDYLDYSPHLFKLQALWNVALKCKRGPELSPRAAVCHRAGLESDDSGMEGRWGANAVINPITSVAPGWPFRWRSLWQSSLYPVTLPPSASENTLWMDG